MPGPHTYHIPDAADQWVSRAEEPETPVEFDKMSLNKFADFVGKAAKTNADKAADAIAKSDGNCFWITHPEVLQTKENVRLINHWLTQGNITNPTYPDYQAAYEDYKDSGLMDLDAAELARDQTVPRSFTGVLTRQVFWSVDDMIAAERQVALSQIQVSAEEAALERLPIETAQALLKEAERMSQREANAPAIQDAADAWLFLHPEWVDSVRNAKLMSQQLRTNGVTNATPADFERAAQQLRASGLVKLSQAELNKQHAAEIERRANEAAVSLFDKTNEEQMYELPLDEIRRRAAGNFSGF